MRKPIATAGERLARRKGKELISALSKKNRKVMDEKIRFLRYVMKNCQLYMRDYEAGQQTALKFLITTLHVYSEAAETRDALVKLHKMPFKIPGGTL